MAYNKQNWVDLPNTSTPISAERLNYMENGIYDASLSGGSGVYVGETEPTEENINAWINPNDNLLKYKNNLEWQNVIASGDTIPIGSIIPFTGTTAPTNWMICDGSEISRTTYEDLFTKIGTTFGEGDGTDTFNLPDLKGRIPIGAGSNDNNTHNFTLGSTGGEYEHTLTVEELAKHNHGVSDPGVGRPVATSGGGSGWTHFTGDSSPYKYNTNETGGNSPHNNIQPYLTVNYIIKYSNSIGLVGNVVNEKSNSTTDSYSCDYMNKSIERANVNLNTFKNQDQTANGKTPTILSDSSSTITTKGGKLLIILDVNCYNTGAVYLFNVGVKIGDYYVSVANSNQNSNNTNSGSRIISLEAGTYNVSMYINGTSDTSALKVPAYTSYSYSIVEL